MVTVPWVLGQKIAIIFIEGQYRYYKVYFFLFLMLASLFLVFTTNLMFKEF